MLYTIGPGHKFVDSDGTIKTSGQTIALSPDMALAHADKVLPLDTPAPDLAPEPTPAPAPVAPALVAPATVAE